MAKIKVAINGFGRIGRMVLKAGLDDKNIEFVAVNDLTDNDTLAHLLKYDSVYGKFDGTVKATDSQLMINNKKIESLSEKDPANLPWDELKVDIVVESTGIFRKREDAEKHIKAGAKKVLLSAPAKSPDINTYVLGVNDKEYEGEDIISNASCTTNCLAPMVKLLHDRFGIKKGLLTTVHAYTSTQNMVDGPHKDLRRARAAAENIIPTTTGAASAVEAVIPEIKGRLDGMAMRVPVVCGSVSDFTVELEKETNDEEINKLFNDAAEGKMKGIVEYSEDPLVSRDIIQNPHSCIFDSLKTTVLGGKGNFVKVLGWYDNEWGYSSRIIDMIKVMMRK